MRMRSRVEFFCCMTLRAHRIARRAQLQGMRLMTIGTDDAFRVHLALRERTRSKNFVALLTVVPVQTWRNQRLNVRVEWRLAMHVLV